MLLEGAIKFANQGKDGLERKDFEASYGGISQCRNIIFELLTSIRADAEPTLAARVKGVYTFMYTHLLEASHEKNIEKLDKVIGLLEYERETWVLVMQKLAAERADLEKQRAQSAADQSKSDELQKLAEDLKAQEKKLAQRADQIDTLLDRGFGNLGRRVSDQRLRLDVETVATQLFGQLVEHASSLFELLLRQIHDVRIPLGIGIRGRRHDMEQRQAGFERLRQSRGRADGLVGELREVDRHEQRDAQSIRLRVLAAELYEPMRIDAAVGSYQQPRRRCLLTFVDVHDIRRRPPRLHVRSPGGCRAPPARPESRPAVRPPSRDATRRRDR